MMTSEHYELELAVTTQPGRDFLQLLESIVYGTDGVRYRTHDMLKTLRRLAGRSQCLELRDGPELVGSYLLVERAASSPGGPLKALYRTCLAVKPEHGGRGLGQQLVQAVRERFLDQAEGRVVLYGSIDPTNTRSQRLAERAGYTQLATLKVVTFTRLLPYRSRRVSGLAEHEREQLVTELRRSLGHHALFDAEESIVAGEVLTYRISGRIVACAQLVPKRVEVTSVGGAMGERFVRFGRHIPGLRSFLRPTTVLQVAAIWAEDEYRDRLIPLFEHAMVHHGTRAMVMMLDDREPLHEWLLGAMRLGWLQFWSAGVEQVRIMAGFAGVSDDEINTIAQRPFWVSALDLE